MRGVLLSEDSQYFTVLEDDNGWGRRFEIRKIRNITFYENSVDSRMTIFTDEVAEGRAGYQCVATREQFEKLKGFVNCHQNLLLEILQLAK